MRRGYAGERSAILQNGEEQVARNIAALPFYEQDRTVPSNALGRTSLACRGLEMVSGSAAKILDQAFGDMTVS